MPRPHTPRCSLVPRPQSVLGLVLGLGPRLASVGSGARDETNLNTYVVTYNVSSLYIVCGQSACMHVNAYDLLVHCVCVSHILKVLMNVSSCMPVHCQSACMQ